MATVRRKRMDQVLITIGVRQFHLAPWSREVSFVHRQLSRDEAVQGLRRWFPEAAAACGTDRRHLIRLYEGTTGDRHRDWRIVTTVWLRAWLAEALRSGRVVAREPQESVRDRLYDGASASGMVIPPVIPDPVLTPANDGVTAFTNYLGPDKKGPWRDETDPEKGDAAVCPATNWRSEAISTISEEVWGWFERNDNRLPERWDESLGQNGGGGFLAGTTTVVQLKKGMVFYRFHGTSIVKTGTVTIRPEGAWWSADLHAGDPRAWCALPDCSSAEFLVKCQTTVDFEALYGMGAPRCTNKPGGPPQFLFPRSRFKSGSHSETDHFTLLR
jgi:hypothetical protein